MIRLLIYLWDALIKYTGANLLDIVTLSLISWGGYKLFKNHLYHIKLDIEELKKSDKAYRDKLDIQLISMFKSIANLKKQVAVRDALCKDRHEKRKI